MHSDKKSADRQRCWTLSRACEGLAAVPRTRVAPRCAGVAQLLSLQFGCIPSPRESELLGVADAVIVSIFLFEMPKGIVVAGNY